MSHRKTEDISTLIDYLLGECDAAAEQAIRKRLEADADFADIHENLTRTFEALRLAPAPKAPDGLVEATMQRIDRNLRLSQLIAREESQRIPARAMFSLRELGAMAAAVLILAAVFIPSVQQGRNLARVKECASNVGRIGTALLTYAGDYDDYLPTADTRLKRWLPEGSEPAASNSAALFKLIGRYESPVIFQCPAVGGGSFVPAGMIDFPAGRFISYSYQHSLGPRTPSVRMMQAVANDMAILADSTPVFGERGFRPRRVRATASDNHRRTGQNVLYLTGRVTWATKPTVGVAQNNIFLAEGVYEYRGVEEPTAPTDSFLLPSYSGPQR